MAEKFKSCNQCKLCYARCVDAATLKRHEDIVHSEDKTELEVTHFTLEDLIYPCEMCPGVKFLTENILRGHKQLQHGIKRNRYSTCNICNKDILTRGMRKHQYSHEKFSTETECTLCYRVFKLPSSLQQHRVKVHGNEAEYHSAIQ